MVPRLFFYVVGKIGGLKLLHLRARGGIFPNNCVAVGVDTPVYPYGFVVVVSL